MSLYNYGKNVIDPDVIRTRSLLIWSQTRYHCATESDEKVEPSEFFLKQRCAYYLTRTYHLDNQLCIKFGAVDPFLITLESDI